MTLTVRDRDTLRWTLFLVGVDAAVWALSALYSTLSVALGLFVAWGALSLLATTALYLHAALGGIPGPVLKGERQPLAAAGVLPLSRGELVHLAPRPRRAPGRRPQRGRAGRVGGAAAAPGGD